MYLESPSVNQTAKIFFHLRKVLPIHFKIFDVLLIRVKKGSGNYALKNLAPRGIAASPMGCAHEHYSLRAFCDRPQFLVAFCEVRIT
jgi:hypothetical protein